MIDNIKDVFVSPQALGAMILIIASTLYLLKSKSETAVAKKVVEDDEDWSSLFEEEKNTAQPGSSSKLKNVFDIKQSAPNISEAPNSSDQKDDDAPFKSSYYYAHNNPKTIGGYKDGLKAEDYVMNGPRLLSKSKQYAEVSNVTSSSKTNNVAKMKMGSTAINRYLWDDDGNTDGIARIIIDTLPTSSAGPSSTSINWQDTGITKEDVKSKLVGVWKNGLILQIRQKINGRDNNSSYKRYHLHVSRMFGEVDEVKSIAKGKKLIVKLYKKKEKENLKAWPQLPSKVASPSNDISYLDEDLFYQEDLKQTE